MNKLEQISSLDHQISLAGGLVVPVQRGTQTGSEWEGSLYRDGQDGQVGGGSLYGEVQCTMGIGHMETPELIMDNGHMGTLWTENITFPQLLWQVVIIQM